MKAAWDWQLPRGTEEEQRRVVEFAVSVGFDTLVVPNPTEAMTDRGGELGLRVLAVVSPAIETTAIEAVAKHLQRMRPVEEAVADALAGAAGYERRAFLWFPIVQPRPLLCFEHDASIDLLKRRVEAAVRSSDGVALDGFGFRNHYGCFCELCRSRPGDPEREFDPDGVATRGEETLVSTAQILYDHAKGAKPDSLVINHVWPPFRPNPYYGNRLRLDYCSQTISWFYRPFWSLARVEFEAKEHKRLEDLRTNSFVPFVGLQDGPGILRSPDRIRGELEVARRYGDGNVVFSTLGPLQANRELRDVIRQELSRMGS